jgi:ribosomal protein S18 acetylase RimI-like enzyme
MREHVDRVYPWKPELFRQTFDPRPIQVVVADEKEVGMLRVTEDAEGLYLGQISIAPSHQGQGIGTMLIERVLSDARTRGLPVRLRVLRGSPAIGLYQRLGFAVVDETETHLYMKVPGS